MNGAELIEWSLFSGKPIGNLKWLNNTTYMIRRYRGLRNTPYWTFSVKFDVRESAVRSICKFIPRSVSILF